jgi:hypothetical protein
LLRKSSKGKLDRLNDDRWKKARYTEKTLAAWNKGKTQEKMERGSRKRSSSGGSEKTERFGGR